MENTSGQGKGAVVPEDAKGLAWGAFLMTWIWGIFNRTWLALLTFVPLIGLVVWVMLLFKGREWAWQNKQWDSVEHFNRVQRQWAKAGLILMGISIIFIVAAIVLPIFLAEDNADMQAAVTPPPVEHVSVPETPTPQPIPETVVVASAPLAAPAMEQAAVETALPKLEKVAVVTDERADSETAPSVVEPRKSASKSARKTVDAEPEESVREDIAPVAEEVTPTRARESYYRAAPGSVVTPKYNDVMTAVIRQDQAAVTQLLDLGWWVDKPDSRGSTPLLEAVSLGDAAMAELLLKRGANPNVVARDYSPLRMAKRNRDAAMEVMLRSYGAAVE